MAGLAAAPSEGKADFGGEVGLLGAGVGAGAVGVGAVGGGGVRSGSDGGSSSSRLLRLLGREGVADERREGVGHGRQLSGSVGLGELGLVLPHEIGGGDHVDRSKDGQRTATATNETKDGRTGWTLTQERSRASDTPGKCVETKEEWGEWKMSFAGLEGSCECRDGRLVSASTEQQTEMVTTYQVDRS